MQRSDLEQIVVIVVAEGLDNHSLLDPDLIKEAQDLIDRAKAPYPAVRPSVDHGSCKR